MTEDTLVDIPSEKMFEHLLSSSNFTWKYIPSPSCVLIPYLITMSFSFLAEDVNISIILQSIELIISDLLSNNTVVLIVTNDIIFVSSALNV